MIEGDDKKESIFARCNDPRMLTCRSITIQVIIEYLHLQAIHFPLCIQEAPLWKHIKLLTNKIFFINIRFSFFSTLFLLDSKSLNAGKLCTVHAYSRQSLHYHEIAFCIHIWNTRLLSACLNGIYKRITVIQWLNFSKSIRNEGKWFH